ncbi:hypothetical protein D3C76_1756680 [compost metagenome]
MPSSFTARHIRPWAMPLTHIEAMYRTVPMVASQKCALIRPMLCICSRPKTFGIMWYSAPMEIIATQPSAPACTWPMVQSV